MHLQWNPPPESRAWPGGTEHSLLPHHTPAPSGCRSGIRSPGVPNGLSRWVWTWQDGAVTVGGTVGAVQVGIIQLVTNMGDRRLTKR